MDPEQPVPAEGDGALARQAPGGGALAKIDGTYAVFATGFTPTAVLGDEVRAARALKDALRVWRADHDYHNFVESPAEAAVAFPHASYQRLPEIRPGTIPTRWSSPPTLSGRPGAEMRRIEAGQETPTPTSVLQAVAESTIGCELLEWPP
jgi:hypothetical protein